MANSNIITNQFVRINQTPASIGERVLARIIDAIFISFGFTGIYLLFDGLMGIWTKHIGLFSYSLRLSFLFGCMISGGKHSTTDRLLENIS